MEPRRDAPPCSHLGIVGLGLIGGSVAAAAGQAWPDLPITGVDEPAALADALDRGWIRGRRPTAAGLADADLIVLATPIPAIVRALDELAQAGVTAVVTDVGSTKRVILQAAARAGLRSFVGGHPIAGAEAGGLAHARADLFGGRPWIVVTDGGAPSEAAGRVEAFAAGLGAVPMRTDAATHDRVMAYVSHLPQVLAVALANAAGHAAGEAGLRMAGAAFADMTRVAASPPALWRGILESNADCVHEALSALRAELDRMDFDRPDLAGLAEWFDEAARFRRLARGVTP